MLPRRFVTSTAALAVAAIVLAGCSGQPAAESTRPAASASSPASPSPAPTPTIATDGPTSIAALGDSLSRGFDACDHFGDCTSASWITGTNTTVDSLASRLTSATGSKVTVYNDAKSGVSVDDLSRQVDLAIAQQPSIVTVLIGANDVCRGTTDDMTSVDDYAATIDTQLRRLADAVPNAIVLVASVPNVTNLIPVASSNSTARFIWQTLGGCATVLADPLSTDATVTARRDVVESRILAFNDALQTSCGSLARCVYDGGAVFNYEPTIAQLSPLDYFHPSVGGLRELAATEWAVLEPLLPPK